MTKLEVLRRCSESPEHHLAKPSICQFMAYELGYEITSGRRLEGVQDTETSERAIIEDYQLSRRWPYNLSFRCFLTAAEGELGGLRKYHEYLQRFALPSEPDLEAGYHHTSVFEFLREQEGFRKRPAMYFGNEVSTEHVWSAISGACWAERDSGKGEGELCDFMMRFQAWIAERFPSCRANALAPQPALSCPLLLRLEPTDLPRQLRAVHGGSAA